MWLCGNLCLKIEICSNQQLAVVGRFRTKDVRVSRPTTEILVVKLWLNGGGDVSSDQRLNCSFVMSVTIWNGDESYTVLTLHLCELLAETNRYFWICFTLQNPLVYAYTSYILYSSFIVHQNSIVTHCYLHTPCWSLIEKEDEHKAYICVQQLQMAGLAWNARQEGATCCNWNQYKPIMIPTTRLWSGALNYSAVWSSLYHNARSKLRAFLRLV